MRHFYKRQHQHKRSQPAAKPGTHSTETETVRPLQNLRADYGCAGQLATATWLKRIGMVGGIVFSAVALLLTRTLPLGHWLVWELFGVAGGMALVAGYSIFRYRRLRATLPDPLPTTIREYLTIHTYKWRGIVGIGIVPVFFLIWIQSGLVLPGLVSEIFVYVLGFSLLFGFYSLLPYFGARRDVIKSFPTQALDSAPNITRRGTTVELRVSVETMYPPPARQAAYFRYPFLKHTARLAFEGLSLVLLSSTIIYRLVISQFGRPYQILGWSAVGAAVLLLVHFRRFADITRYGLRLVTRRPIQVTSTELIVPLALMEAGQPNAFRLDQLQHLRLEPQPDRHLAALCFDSAGQEVRTRPGLFDQEMQPLMPLLTELLTFRPHAIERLVFGNFPIDETEAPRTLRNPDVTTLTFPFQRLRQIVIDADSYDFHQLEHFLTYAVNVIGEEYLKDQVEVEIHGDAARLHPNLRNALMNLCRKVTSVPEAL